MAEWRYYGREKEMGKVRSLVTRPRFTPLAVGGRRRIGKTLMLEFVADELKGTKQMVFIEIPGAERNLGKAMEDGLDEALESGRLDPGLADRMRTPLAPRVEGGSVPTDPAGIFRRRLENMIEAGIAVVLEECPHGEALAPARHDAFDDRPFRSIPQDEAAVRAGAGRLAPAEDDPHPEQRCRAALRADLQQGLALPVALARESQVMDTRPIQLGKATRNHRDSAPFPKR